MALDVFKNTTIDIAGTCGKKIYHSDFSASLVQDAFRKSLNDVSRRLSSLLVKEIERIRRRLEETKKDNDKKDGKDCKEKKDDGKDKKDDGKDKKPDCKPKP